MTSCSRNLVPRLSFADVGSPFGRILTLLHALGAVTVRASVLSRFAHPTPVAANRLEKEFDYVSNPLYRTV